MVERHSTNLESFRKAMQYAAFGDYEAAEHFYEKIGDVRKFAFTSADSSYVRLEQLMADAALTEARQHLDDIPLVLHLLDCYKEHAQQFGAYHPEQESWIEEACLAINMDLVARSMLSSSGIDYHRAKQVLHFADAREGIDTGDIEIDLYAMHRQLDEQRAMLQCFGFLESCCYSLE